MGQPITISGRTVEGAIAAFHADRSITGQDGVSYSSADEAAAPGSFSGDLAARMFAADDGIDHVFMASNQVVVRRPGSWDDAALSAVAEVIEQFFVFYAGA